MRVLLIVYDNDSHIHYFPLGSAYIAAALEQAGHDVEIWNQDIHHYSDESLTTFLDENHFDVVGMGLIAGYYQYAKFLKLSEAINRAKRRPLYILGGAGPSPEPEYFLKKAQADAAVIAEGDETVVELLAAFENKTPLKDVLGIAFFDGSDVVITPERPQIADLDTLPRPAYHKFPVEIYRLRRMPRATNTDFTMPVLTTRGCTFKCTFCYRMDKGLRAFSTERLIDEVSFLKKTYGINYVDFSDELLMVSVDRTLELAEAFIKADLGIKFRCNGRLNYAQKPEILDALKRAGCVYINYGIEAMDDDVLRLMKKGLRVDQVLSGIKHTLDADISPGFNIIFGNKGDTVETLKKGVDFLLEFDDGAELRTIRPVTPYPGSPLYFDAIREGKLKDVTDFYENKHVNSDLLAVNFTELSDDTFHQALCDANKRLLDNYYEKMRSSAISQTESLYLEQNAEFRGYRHH
jgi:anaerobic magnesium-protoporphyrin IX monomethyl ester cyclase